MRKLCYIIIFVLCGIYKVFSQGTTPNISANKMFVPQSLSVFYGVENGNGKLSYDEIQGSPYLNVKYSSASIPNVDEVLMVKYNSYLDQIEFLRDNQNYVLPKDVRFSRVKFSDPNLQFVLLESEDGKPGYFVELYKDKISLYKKYSTKFMAATSASNSYASSSPPSFKQLEPMFYLLTEDRMHKITKNGNDFISKMGNESNLKSYMKTNKIKLNKEEDLIELVKFLNKN